MGPGSPALEAMAEGVALEGGPGGRTLDFHHPQEQRSCGRGGAKAQAAGTFQLDSLGATPEQLCQRLLWDLPWSSYSPLLCGLWPAEGLWRGKRTPASPCVFGEKESWGMWRPGVKPRGQSVIGGDQAGL